MHLVFVLQTEIFFHHLLCTLLFLMPFPYFPLNSSDLFKNSFLCVTKLLRDYTDYILHTGCVCVNEYGAYMECETYCIRLKLHVHFNMCLLSNIRHRCTAYWCTNKSVVISMHNAFPAALTVISYQGSANISPAPNQKKRRRRLSHYFPMNGIWWRKYVLCICVKSL